MITDFFTQTIVVEKITRISNNMGGYSESWGTHITIKGYIDLLSGNELEKANQLNIEATHILLTDKGKDIIESHRINFSGKFYRIKYVDTVFSHHMEIYLEYIGIDQL